MSDLLSKFIMKKKTEDVIHSSIYGEAQSGDRIGATSSQGFNERMMIEKNRNRIRGFNDSRLVTQARVSSGTKAKVYEAPEKKDGFLDKKSQINSSTDIKHNGVATTTFSTSSVRNTSANGLSRPPAVRNPGISKKI